MIGLYLFHRNRVLFCVEFLCAAEVLGGRCLIHPDDRAKWMAVLGLEDE